VPAHRELGGGSRAFTCARRTPALRDSSGTALARLIVGRWWLCDNKLLYIQNLMTLVSGVQRAFRGANLEAVIVKNWIFEQKQDGWQWCGSKMGRQRIWLELRRPWCDDSCFKRLGDLVGEPNMRQKRSVSSGLALTTVVPSGDCARCSTRDV
jgi:hypothetical protein